MSETLWYLHSPLGMLTLIEQDDHLVGLHFGKAEAVERPVVFSPLMREAAEQLNAYFQGILHQFCLPLAPGGTVFQQSCWQALCAIPYGETRTYAQQAQAIGQPKAVRAVGMANHRNPLPIFIPCHRVIGKDGSLTGYAGGLAAKRYLLELEAGCGG